MNQLIKHKGSGSCLVFWDLGSEVALVTTEYTKEQQLQ
jgi:hypothetical protein